MLDALFAVTVWCRVTSRRMRRTGREREETTRVGDGTRSGVSTRPRSGRHEAARRITYEKGV